MDPGYTVLLDDGTFSFCDSRHFQQFDAYRDHAVRCIYAARHQPDRSMGEKDHMFFITNLPWFSFTAFTHPYDETYGSIPILTIGKYLNEGDRLLLPVAIQVHHGLVDGIHVGHFYDRLRCLMDDAQILHS